MRIIYLLLSACVLCLSSFSAGWTDPGDACPAKAPDAPRKERNMYAENFTVQSSPAIPPIDQAAPAAFETAAFGLG
jgi:hypothetical protein